MTTYYVDIKNETERTWTMAVYQQLPESVGLDSVSWKQATSPRHSETGVKWEVNYLVATADYVMSRPLGVYMANQTLPTTLGKKWRCVWQDNCQQLVEDGDGTPGHILIANESGFKANLGIGMDGEGSVFKKDVLSNENAQFRVEPTYWVGLFRNVVIGEVISGNVIVGPEQIKFTGDMNCATLRVWTEGETTKYKIVYSIKGEMSEFQLRAAMAMDYLREHPEALPLLETVKEKQKLKR